MKAGALLALFMLAVASMPSEGHQLRARDQIVSKSDHTLQHHRNAIRDLSAALEMATTKEPKKKTTRAERRRAEKKAKQAKKDAKKKAKQAKKDAKKKAKQAKKDAKNKAKQAKKDAKKAKTNNSAKVSNTAKASNTGTVKASTQSTGKKSLATSATLFTGLAIVCTLVQVL